MTTPPGFDELIHPTTRLALMALLAAAEWAEFAFVRDTLQLSDSALSKQIGILQQADYVEVHKEGAGRRRRTTVRLTTRGRDAFAAHAAALRQIVDPKHRTVLVPGIAPPSMRPA